MEGLLRINNGSTRKAKLLFAEKLNFIIEALVATTVK